jgi:glycerol-3-phosphate dehydrogenase
VNATAPWVEDRRVLDGSKKGKTLHRTKGVHIVVDRVKFPVQQSIYFDIPDGRMIFAIPRNNITYIGTTDTNYDGDKDEVHATKVDAEYLINGVNESFPAVNLTVEDIQSSWAGLRPLIHEEGKSPSELSRKDEIFESKSGLISIAGGKLTGYRKMAERIVDLVIEKHFEGVSLSECHTENLKLVGADFDEPIEVNEFLEDVIVRLQKYNLEKYGRYLVYNYGKNTTAILDHLESDFSMFNSETLANAEAWYCINYEMALTPVDFFVRRTGMLFFDINRTKGLVEPISKVFAKEFGWDEDSCKSNEMMLRNVIHVATKFKGAL